MKELLCTKSNYNERLPVHGNTNVMASLDYKGLAVSGRVIIFLLLLNSVLLPLNSQIKGFDKIRWEKEKIAPGLVWKSAHTIVEDTIPQNINLLIVNLHKRRISILYNPGKNVLTSKQASDAGAISALNAGFFNIKEGGSVTYIRTGGKIMDSDTSKKWPKNANLNGALAIEKGKRLTVMEAKNNDWFDAHTEYDDILVTGPVLILDKKKVILPKIKRKSYYQIRRL